MILEPSQATGSDVDVLRLFLGPAPLVVFGRSSEEPGPTVFESSGATVGSALVVAGSDSRTTAARLPALLAECRHRLSEDGRIAVLASNRARVVVDALRLRPFRSWRSTGKTSVLRSFFPMALRDAVRSAGFADPMIFRVAPSAEHLEELRPFTFADHWSAPAFVVIASRSGRQGRFLLGDALKAMGGELTRHGSVTPDHVVQVANSSRGKSLAMIESEGASAVVRVARALVMREDETVSYRLLEQLQRNPAIRSLVPRPLGEATAGDFAFFAQARLPGTPLYRWINDSNRGHYVGEVERFLRGLNAEMTERAPVSFESGFAASTINPMVEFALAQVADPGLRAAASARLSESLRGATGRLGIVHGDFGTANILIDKQRLTGVIDWEAGRPWGPPILDAFNYLDSVHRSCSGSASSVDTIPLLGSGSWPVPQEADFLRSMFEFCGIDTRFQRGLAMLYALFHFGPQLRFASVARPRSRLERVLRWFVES